MLASESELQAELVQARLIAGASDHAARRQIEAAAGVTKAGRIGHIEHLGAEIEDLRLRNPELLDERHVELDQLVAAQDVATGIAVSEVRRQGEGVRLVRKERPAGGV